MLFENISSVCVLISPFLFLIFLIWILPICPLVSLIKVFVYLVDFLKERAHSLVDSLYSSFVST